MSTVHLGYSASRSSTSLLTSAPREMLPAIAAAIAGQWKVRVYRVKKGEHFPLEWQYLLEAELDGLGGFEPGGGSVALLLERPLS